MFFVTLYAESPYYSLHPAESFLIMGNSGRFADIQKSFMHRLLPFVFPLAHPLQHGEPRLFRVSDR